MTFEINDRIYNDIELYCKANNLDVAEYISELITERHLSIKYGDLNVMMDKVNEQSTAETKKSARVANRKEKVKVGDWNNDDVVAQENETSGKNERTDNTELPNVDESIKSKAQRKKRTLKTL